MPSSSNASFPMLWKASFCARTFLGCRDQRVMITLIKYTQKTKKKTGHRCKAFLLRLYHFLCSFGVFIERLQMYTHVVVSYYRAQFACTRTCSRNMKTNKEKQVTSASGKGAPLVAISLG